ncbi:MAG: peptidylprolyl isomerase [Dehalococcoidales bacterium]
MKKILIIFSCIIATSCLIGAMLLSSCDSTPIAKNGDTVQVNYTLTLADGTLYQTTVGNQPLEFVIGEGDYLPDFEKAIVGMKVGESKTITILSADAYGDIREDLICTLDKSQLAAGVEPKVGDTLKTTDTSGRTIVVVVTAVSDTTLTIDANFPLAGKDLTFKIELLKIS